MPLFSVIIPSFNRAELLKAALESVMVQNYQDREIIVVDDGSTDGTIDALDKFRSVITILRQANKGPGAARNFAAGHARGDYLTFLDSDDLWFPWTLNIYRDAVLGQSSPSFVAGRPALFTKESELLSVGTNAIETTRFPDYLESGDNWRWWGVSSFVIRRDAFLKVGGFTNERVNGEDADLAMRLGISPGFVQITSPATFAYRQHPTSAMKDVKLTLAGAWVQVRAEKIGRYPGGSARARQRYRILTRHIRPITLSCLQEGLRLDAWRLYAATFGWNAQLRRAKYLAAFPVLAAASLLRAEPAGARGL